MDLQVRCNMNRGFSLIEMLIVVAISGMILAIATYSYTPTVRAFRAKKAIQNLKGAIAEARRTAARENRNVVIRADGTGVVNVFLDENDNNALDAGTDTHMIQMVMTGDVQDPGRPENIMNNYHFEQYVILAANTRNGVTALDRGSAIGYAGDDVYDQIPFMTQFTIQARPNGFLRIIDPGGNEVPFGAILCLHANDIEEGDVTTDRHYALGMAITGWLQTYRLDRDGNWVEY